MSKKIVILVLTLALLPATTWGREGGGGGGGKMNVQVRQVIVRVSPDYLSRRTGSLNYGESVTVVGKDAGWYHIDAPSGWVPKAALSKHKIKINPDQKFAAGTERHDEVALAGKGFNPQVEAQYKKDHPALRAAFADVDRMEKFGVTEAQLKQFRTAGKLR